MHRTETRQSWGQRGAKVPQNAHCSYFSNLLSREEKAKTNSRLLYFADLLLVSRRKKINIKSRKGVPAV